MYYYYSKEEVNVSELKTRSPPRSVRRSRQARQVLHISNGFALLIFIVSAIVLHYFPQSTQLWADILGVSLAIGACLQWLPQIVTTWRLGHLGSLSPASLFFLAPYTWTFGINMIVRVGIKGWSAWIVYVLVGTMQLVLIGFAITFSLRPSNQEIECDSLDYDKVDLLVGIEPLVSEPASMSQVDERSPLLLKKSSTA